MSKRSREAEKVLFEGVKRVRLSEEEIKEFKKKNEHLRKVFAKGREEMLEDRRKQDKAIPSYPFSKPKGMIELKPEPKYKPLTLQEAKKMEAINKSLREKFANARSREELDREIREQQYEPITRAIKEHKLAIATDTVDFKQKKLQALKEPTKQNRLNSAVFRPRAMSTPTQKDFHQVPLPDDVPLPDESEEETATSEESLQEYMEKRSSQLGPLARIYLPLANDKSFGIWYDLGAQTLKIGHTPVTIKMDNIILNKVNKVYKGTRGLWRLVTSSSYIENDQYTSDDLERYKDILMKTSAIYHNNDPTSSRPKASGGHKWKKMIKPIWDEQKIEQMQQETDNDVTGSGLKLYSEDPIEYKHIGSLRELFDRLTYIEAQEGAGNNNFHSEKMSIVKFIIDCMELEELIAKPNGIKYLARCLSVLPEYKRTGSGLLSDILKKLFSELHASRYNFMDPGTTLEQRLRKGDRGINPLDEAAREDDIWYSKHKRAEDRWKADRVLQDKMFERVIAPNADLSERLWGLTAGSAM